MSDLFGDPAKRCTQCREWGAELMLEMNPPDDSTRIRRWFCDTTCYANYSTGQLPAVDRLGKRP